MRSIIKVILYISLFLSAALIIFFLWAGSGSLSEDKLSGIRKYSDVFGDFYQEKGRLKVMTYNCGYFSGMRNNLPVVSNREYFIKNLNIFTELLSNIRPDIICFQEIDFNSHRSHHINQSHYLSDKLNYPNYSYAVNWDKRYVPFPYWPPSAHFKKMVSGQSIVSMFPLRDTKRVKLKRADNPFYYDKFYLDRLLQETIIEIGDKKIVLMNVHLESYDKDTREEQAEFILNYYRKTYKKRYPVILLGDFNCGHPASVKQKNFPDEPDTDFEDETTIKIIMEESSLTEAFSIQKGEFNTYPADKPNRQLDYIFYTNDSIELLNASVLKIVSSDHLPVVVEFRFKEKLK